MWKKPTIFGVGGAVIVAAIAVAAYHQQRYAVSEGYDIKCAQSSEPASAPDSLTCKIQSTQNAEYGHPDVPWWYVLVAWPEGITAWLLLLTFGAVTWQAWETRTAAEAGLKSAEAAKASADIAVGVSLPTLVVHALGQGDVGDATPEAFFQNPRMKIVIKNYGQTPAFLKFWCLCFTCEDLPEFPIYEGPAVGMVLNKEVVQPNAVYTLPQLGFPYRQEFSIEDAQAIVRREKRFWVYGYVCYADIFGNRPCRLKFCETVLNVFGAQGMVCDWVEGFAPPAYTGTEQFPTKKQTPKPQNPN